MLHRSKTEKDREGKNVNVIFSKTVAETILGHSFLHCEPQYHHNDPVGLAKHFQVFSTIDLQHLGRNTSLKW